ncbi:hypothetical protein M404DRAFT_318157 [Pisolithus tinctorius Marx 270]|uniref:Uncharacterized protein n=1 Tax=Pisolithus tinctorius Marx 270 TaxID=870435 RepID=A0A0C3NJ49_PISTI|nr:hypothetical protein M404DRAFT_318157 [Pisolithus tinctorius Marx 270]
MRKTSDAEVTVKRNCLTLPLSVRRPSVVCPARRTCVGLCRIPPPMWFSVLKSDSLGLSLGIYQTKLHFQDSPLRVHNCCSLFRLHCCKGGSAVCRMSEDLPGEFPLLCLSQRFLF